MNTPPRTFRDVPREIEDQLALYFDNQATPEVVQAIQDWLQADPANAQTFAEYGTIERMIYNAQKTEDASAIFALLQEAEGNESPHPPIRIDARALTKQKYLDALTYVLRHTFTPKRVAVLASAAVLLLGVVLAIVILSGPSEEEPIAELPDVLWPSDEVPVAQHIVATLTAEHDAQWDRRPGEDLFAGQRFTLTQGFAEITTAAGAIAILEAPATIELLDSNNAIRLHTGKLVGVCETDSSKGFIVHTPHMQITDLGTRFGVEADPAGTDIQVLDGIVEVTRDGSSMGTTPTTPQRVFQGEAVRAMPGSARIVRISADAATFVDLLDKAPTPLERLLKDDALIAAYLVGETDASGQTLTNVAETTGQAMAGMLKGKPQFIEGPRPDTTALRFKAKDKTHVILPNWNQHAPDRQVSFAVWVRLSPDASKLNTILSQWSHGLWNDLPAGAFRQDRVNLMIANRASHTGYIPAGRSRMCLQFYQKDSALPILMDQGRDAGTILPEDGWVHVAFTMDRQRGSALYFNGKPIERVSGPLAGPLFEDSSLPLVLGGKPSGDLYYDGDMAQVLFLERALSAEEIHQLYQSTRPSTNSPITFPTGQ